MAVEIIVNESNCVGCLICQLWCSFNLRGIFQPDEALIIIRNPHSLKPEIIFKDACSRCGQCARHCLYDALSLKGGD